jgi:hypothetical protein
MVLTRIVLCIFVFGSCAMGALGQTVSVVNTSTVVSSISGNIDVYLKVEPLGKGANLPDLVAEDVTGPDKSAFRQVGSPTLVGRSDTKAYWRTCWHADGQVANLVPVRVLWIRFGTVSELVSVTLQKPSAPQVTVTAPGYPLKLIDSHDLAFQIVSSARLTHVVPSFATLVEEKTGQVIPVNQLSIVDSTGSGKTNPDGTTVELPGQVIQLRVSSDFVNPGKFSGTVSLSSREKADLGTISVTVYSTASRWKVYGGLYVILGVAIYFGVAVWAKARNKQLLAMLPAARLREEAQSIKKIILEAKRRTGFAFGNLLGPASDPISIDYLIESLRVQELKNKGYLPQQFFSAFSGQDPSPAYQTFLATTGNQVAVLEMIVRWGIASVLQMWPSVEKASKQDAGTTALKHLDDLGAAPPVPDQVKLSVQNEIAGVAAAISPKEAFGGGVAEHVDMGPKEITIQLQELSIFIWVLWGVVTVFVGLCALVLFNDAFGRPQDYIQCVLWGIGMPAVAQGFGGLTAGSVTSALSLPIPR